LGEHIQQWRPNLPVIGIVAAVLVIGSILYVIFSGEDTSSAMGWQSYYAAYGEPKVDEALKQVTEKQKDSLPGRWAKLALADQELRQAVFQLGQNPKEAKATLARVEKSLKEWDGATTEPDLRTRVRMSLAKLYETQNKLEEARKYYGDIVSDKNEKDGTFSKVAARGLKRLGPGSDVHDVLAWLDKQDTSKRTKPPAGGGFDFGPPEALPERPDLSIPGEMKLGAHPPLGPDFKAPTLPGTDGPLFPKKESPDQPKGETPKTETPKSESKSPPAVPKPVKAAEKSAEPEKKPPSEEKPAAEKKSDIE